LPFVTMFGLILPGLIGGSVIIESIFSWPGMGRMAHTDAQLDQPSACEGSAALLSPRKALLPAESNYVRKYATRLIW